MLCYRNVLCTALAWYNYSHLAEAFRSQPHISPTNPPSARRCSVQSVLFQKCDRRCVEKGTRRCRVYLQPPSLHVLTCLLPSLLLSDCMLCPPLSLCPPCLSLCVLDYAALWISGCPHEQRMYPNHNPRVSFLLLLK